MISDIELMDWTEQTIEIPFRIGEISLWCPTLAGIRCAPDIFLTLPLTAPRPPITTIRKNNVNAAYAFSYPLETKPRRISIVDKFLCLVDTTYKHYYVETKGDFDTYLALKNKKTISTLRRKLKKIQNSNGNDNTFRVYSSPGEIEEFFYVAMPISQKSYQKRLLQQGLPNTQEFINDAISKSKKGDIFGYILYIDKTPAAYNLCPVYGGNKVLYDHTGYDPAFSSFSPGTILQFQIIEDLFQRDNIEYYDLCTGEGMHKEIFATGYIFCGNIFFLAINIKNVSIVFLREILSLIDTAGRRILEIVGLKSALKKLIRKSA